MKINIASDGRKGFTFWRIYTILFTKLVHSVCLTLAVPTSRWEQGLKYTAHIALRKDTRCYLDPPFIVSSKNSAYLRGFIALNRYKTYRG